MKTSSKINASLSDIGHVFCIAGTRYIAPSTDHDFVPAVNQDFCLATVFTLPRDNKSRVTKDWIRANVDKYNSHDDIFDNAFLTTVIFHGAEEDTANVSEEAREYLSQLGTDRIFCTSSPVQLLPGPYAIVGEQLRDVWKLVDDINGTCMVTLKPRSKTSDQYEPFPLRSADDRFSSFALRSQTKDRAASGAPLAGMRVLVKDNIHLKGIKTSIGNRDFYETYPPRPESAACVQKLIDQGAVIIGKTKMNSLGTWEEPVEYIDYQAPWNPRADGFQSPGGSSSGSAAAVATYDWLDVAIGTDTWGSVTRPALWCGCYGLRPSLGAVSTQGIEPYCQVFDTAGILGIDLQKCKNFAAEWLSFDALQKDPKPFSSIIWPTDYWKIIDSKQIQIARQFVQRTQEILKADLREISFEGEWAKIAPVESNGRSLSEFIDEAAGVQDYDACHNLDNFREKHWEMRQKAPYVSPPNQRAWKYAQTISKEDRDEGFKRIEVYKNWFATRFLGATTNNSLIIMPQESMQPRYRDEPRNFPRLPGGINALALAAVLGAPALTVPIAEIPFHSRVSDRKEKLPFAVTIVGNPGTDLALMDIVCDVLKKVNLPTTVKTGTACFG